MVVDAPLGKGHVVLFLKGALITLFVSALAMALAIPLGMMLSLLRMYGGPISRRLAGAYVEIYRGTPVLLQLYLLYYGLAPVLNALQANRRDFTRPEDVVDLDALGIECTLRSRRTKLLPPAAPVGRV